jgi:membrane protein DedA with SNARE-associated domain
LNELTRLVLRYGLTFLFLNVFLEQIGVPIPAVPTLVVAGALVADGRLPGPAALAAAFFATVLADSVWFGLGRLYGQRILKLLCKVSLSPDSCVRRTESLFERWGLSSLLLAKFIPGFSTVAPPLAGASRASFARFLLFTSGGTLLWAGAALLGGMLFHDAVESVLTFLTSLGGGALVIVGAALAMYVAFRWRQRRRFFKALRMARISVEDLYRLMQEGKPPLIVDVRTPQGRMRDPRRIPGAIVLDTENLDAQIRELPTVREIVLYCT